MRTAMAATFILSLSAAAAADEVVLTQGRSLVGIARRDDGRVVVETRHGTITVPASQVKSIVPGRTPVHEYREKLANLGSSPDAAQVYALAVWAREQGLIRYVAALQQWTIALDPNHKQARADLDYVQYQGRWVLKQDRDAYESGRQTQVQKKQQQPTTTEEQPTTPETETTTTPTTPEQPPPEPLPGESTTTTPAQP